MKVAACVIVKDEARYLEEWFSYLFAVGFDHVFVYDNESSDDTPAIIKAVEAQGLATYNRWPNEPKKRAQLTAYNHCRARLAEYDWVLFLDADEIVNLKRHSSIQGLLQDQPADVCAVWLNWRMFGSSGEPDYKRVWLTSRFTQASIETFGPNNLGKAIVRVDALAEAFIHTHRLVDGAKFINTAGEAMQHFPKARQSVIRHDVVQLNHYFTRSRAEWELKKLRGKADLPLNHPDRVRADDEFTFNDRNDETDITVHAWRSKALTWYGKLFAGL